MMPYGLEFLSAALLLLGILILHFARQPRVRDTNSHVFGFFLCLGFLDVLFDIISTVLISGDYPQYAVAAKLVLTVFYAMQILIPCAMLCYTQSLRMVSAGEMRSALIKSIILPAYMILAVIGNYFFGYFFYFDESGQYFRGSWYLLPYGYALFYGIQCLICAALHLEDMEKDKPRIVAEVVFVEVASVAVQALTGLLTTGLGLALGITVLYLTVNNPGRYTDSLTGTLDKRYFRRWMKSQSGKSWKQNLIAVELRQLKQVNKVLGTSWGDELLQQVGTRLQEISEDGPVFRTGGNQYVMVSASLEKYRQQLEALQGYFNGIFHVKGESVRFPAVICGIRDAGRMEDTDALEAYMDYLISLVPNVDDPVTIQDDEKTLSGFRYEQEVERYLNTAIENDLFEIHFQPVYSLKRERFISLEALSRLNHPSLGPVSPEVFFGIAERNGKVAEIALLQFRRVCRFVSEHRELLEILDNVKFNLSPAELLAPGHSGQLISLIRKYQLPPSFFQFEITETVATEYSKRLYRLVEDLRQEGIGLCLDDFGSGYSNLNAVLRMPFSCIKLDRSMLRSIDTDSVVSRFYSSIVSVLHSMGYRVIAEGVETEREVEILRSYGVTLIQGYFYSKPLPEQEILKLLLEDK